MDITSLVALINKNKALLELMSAVAKSDNAKLSDTATISDLLNAHNSLLAKINSCVDGSVLTPERAAIVSGIPSIVSTVNQSPIKRIQRGTLRTTRTSDLVISIPTVNPAKCITTFTPSRVDNNFMRDSNSRFRLFSTTLRFYYRDQAFGGTWQIIEFN